MATLYQQLAANIQEFARIVDEAKIWTEGGDDETFALPDGRVVNSFAKSVAQLQQAAQAIENLPEDLASSAAGKGASLVNFRNGLSVQSALPALSVFSDVALRFLLNPPESGQYGDGVTDATAPIQAAIDTVGAGGGTIYIPRGDYPVELTIASPKISIVCEPGVIFRAINSNPVVTIVEAGEGAVIDGALITGQTKAEDGSEDVSALHSLAINAANVTLRKVTTRAARQDGVYLTHIGSGPTNLIAEKCFFDSTSRNPFTIIAARDSTLRDCRLRLDNGYVGGADVDRGYYIFDLEPNYKNEIFHGLIFDNCTFINAGTKAGNNSIAFKKNNNGTDAYGVTVRSCKFISENGADAPALRIVPESGNAEWFVIEDLRADGLVFVNSDSDGIVNLKNSEISNVIIGATHVFYGVTVGAGTSLRNIKRKGGGSAAISGVFGGAIRQNIAGYADYNNNEAGFRTGTGHRFESRIVVVSDNRVFSNILRLTGTGTFKITIAGCDPNGGNHSAHISESWFLAMNDTSEAVPPNVIYNNTNGYGASVEWTNGNELAIKPDDYHGDRYSVTVEVFSVDQDAIITWLNISG